MPSVFFEVPVFYSNPNPGSHLRRVFSASNKAPAGQQAKKSRGSRRFYIRNARAGSRTVLKAWLVRQSSASNPGSSSGFSHASIEVRASKGFEGLAKLGILELVHGFSVKIAASVNVLSLYSPSEGKIWVMAAKLKDEEGTSKLKGEGLEPRNLDNGVRVWPLRPLVKGKQKKTVHDSVSMYERSVDEVSMNGGRVGDLDQSNLQLTSAEIVTKSIKSETKANELHVEVVLKKVDSVRDDTILSSGRCNGGEITVADILKGVDVSKACKKEINGSASADRPKNSLVRGLDGERGPDVKGHPRNGVIRSVNGSVVLKNNGEIWSNSAGARCNSAGAGASGLGIKVSLPLQISHTQHFIK